MTLDSSAPRPRRPDRRRKPTNPLTRQSLFRGRRRVIRRDDDRERNVYVDRYRLLDVAIFFSVVVMSTCDAFITLRLISEGGEEINPIMDRFLQLGPVAFLVVKFAVTGASLLFLLVHKDYRFWGRLSGRTLLLIFNGLYACLLVWEYVLLSRLHS